MQSCSNGCDRPYDKHAFFEVCLAQEFGHNTGEHHFRGHNGSQTSRDGLFHQPGIDLL